MDSTVSPGCIHASADQLVREAQSANTPGTMSLAGIATRIRAAASRTVAGMTATRRR